MLHRARIQLGPPVAGLVHVAWVCGSATPADTAPAHANPLDRSRAGAAEVLDELLWFAGGTPHAAGLKKFEKLMSAFDLNAVLAALCTLSLQVQDRYAAPASGVS